MMLCRELVEGFDGRVLVLDCVIGSICSRAEVIGRIVRRIPWFSRELGLFVVLFSSIVEHL